MVLVDRRKNLGRMSYLISIKALDYFVVRAWWGERIVIDLDHLRVTEVSEFEDLLLEHERKLVLAKLTQVVRKANPSYIGGSSMKLDEYDPTSVFFASPEVSRSEKPTIATSRFDCGVPCIAALLGCFEAIPLLNELECQLTFSSTYHCYCYEYQESNRAAIQFALRLLGAKPKQGGCVLFKKCGREMITESALFIRMDRHQCLSKIIAGIPTEKAYQLLGHLTISIASMFIRKPNRLPRKRRLKMKPKMIKAPMEAWPLTSTCISGRDVPNS